MVPTKKVDKITYELWHEKVPSLSYLKVWGCEALVKRDTPNKLEARYVKCIFIGYPKETMSYYFYYPPENKIFVSRYAEFFESGLILQEASGSNVDVELIQDTNTQPFENTSQHHNEVEHENVKPQSDIVLIRKSNMITQAPDQYGFYVNVEEHELGDHNEPANYKAKLLDPESDNWVEETLSPVADIRAIRIPIAIVAFYHYDIWQMDVKTDFLNVHLNEDVYMVQPEGLVDPKYPIRASESNVALLILYVDDILIMGNNIPMLQDVKSWLEKCFAMKDFGEATYILGIKIYRDRSKRLIGAFTPEEVRHMKRFLYASVVGSIMYAMRRNTKDMFLVYFGDLKKEFIVICYTDDGYETDIDDTKSQKRYVFMLNGGVVDWKSAKHSTTAMSTKAEYIAASEATMGSVWIRKFVSRL
ncbi:retrotransposon protein, putative, ty1-copia subclass [Tanacetum coccineum]